MGTYERPLQSFTTIISQVRSEHLIYILFIIDAIEIIRLVLEGIDQVLGLPHFGGLDALIFTLLETAWDWDALIGSSLEGLESMLFMFIKTVLPSGCVGASVDWGVAGDAVRRMPLAAARNLVHFEDRNQSRYPHSTFVSTNQIPQCLIM